MINFCLYDVAAVKTFIVVIGILKNYNVMVLCLYFVLV